MIIYKIIMESGDKLDAKDKKLLYEIDLNARIGTSLLGKKVGLSQEGVFYRLKRLERNKIVSGFITLVNFGKLGYTGYGVYARFHNVDKNKKEKIFDELKHHDHIYWIADFSGGFDLAFAIIAKNVVHFNEILTHLMAKYGGFMKNFTVAIRVELIQFPRSYLLNKKSGKEILRAPRFGKYIESENIDDLDVKILSNISSDARISNLELAKKIKHPFSTVNNRIKNLEKREIIQGYSAKINCQEFGYQSFQLFVQAQNITLEKKRKLLYYCQQHPNIIFFIETVGKWNFEIIYEVENQRRFQELMTEFRTIFSDIIYDIESIMLFDHYIKYNQYPLR